MADYRRHFDEGPRRPEREWTERPSDEGRPWFNEGAPEERPLGTYRTDDREYHDRYRHLRSVPHNPEDWGQQHVPARDEVAPPSWRRLEQGGYWRRYEARGFQGRGPKGYQRSDDRIRDEICDCMTDDPMLDASEVEVMVVHGEVTLSGSVSSRDQKRRAEDVAERISGVRDVTNQLRITRDTAGHNWAADSSRASGPGTTSSQPVTQASGKGTASKSTTGNTA